MTSESFEPIHVLSRPAFKNRRINPYNASINDHLASHGICIAEYRPFQTLFRRCDVVHVHWPETTFNHDLPSALATTEALLQTLTVAQRRGGRILWTAHNVFAHDGRHPGWEARFWRRYVRLVDGWIALTETGATELRRAFPSLATKPSWVLPHPHYRGSYPDTTSRDEARRRLGIPSDAKVLLFFGNILEYKNVPGLIRAFRMIAERHLSLWLVVAGRPIHRRFDISARGAPSDHPRIQLHLRHIETDEVQTFFRCSDRVVLPYREVTNSGSALLALSFDRPVFMPAIGPMPALREQIGSRWIHLYNEWSSTALEEEVQTIVVTPDRTNGSHLAPFDPKALAGQTATIYRDLASSPVSAPHG